MNNALSSLFAQASGLASSFKNIFTDKVAVQVAPPTPAALPVPDAVPSNKAGE